MAYSQFGKDKLVVIAVFVVEKARKVVKT